jgi:predicted GNAT superfamily acetyltransferase
MASPAHLSPDQMQPGQPLAGALLALNNEHEVELSRLDAPRLARLVDASFAALIVGQAEAFLLAFDETSDYDSFNFLWLRDRYDRFVYVDRVVVAPSARGRGLARQLYAEVFARTRASGRSLVVCEVNADPPNPASMAFHRALGFTEVGRARTPAGKLVSYLACDLSAPEVS